MKSSLFTIFLTFNYSIGICQLGTVISLSDSDGLYKIKSIPFYSDKKQSCGDSIYWDIVKKGPDAIPFLIKKITDTTNTKIIIPCHETYLRIGDLAYLLIDEIASVPLALVTQMQWCIIEIGCDFGQSTGVFSYIHNNREEFAKLLLSWYTKYNHTFHKKGLTPIEMKGCRPKHGLNYTFEGVY